MKHYFEAYLVSFSKNYRNSVFYNFFCTVKALTVSDLSRRCAFRVVIANYRASFLISQAVNILRTAPYVCTMLIESCVAAPATPNGKPAMPGSQSASAFYQPNRQQHTQPMMQRHPSLESQYSAMHQQFVPSQSHQIEDIVSVSTLSIDKTKSETVLPLEKRSSSEAMACGRPFEVNPAVVSAQIKERAKKKKLMVAGSVSHEELPEKRVDHFNTSPREGQTSMGEPKCSDKVDIAAITAQDSAMGVKKKKSVSGISFLGGLQAKREEQVDTITNDVETSKGDHQLPGANALDQQSASWGETLAGNNISQGIPQGEHPLLDEKSTLLDFPEPKTTQSEDSNVVGFFRKIQSFLFSPSSFKPKRSDESESSCCESDFDSEFSEMTSGSFNPGEIEAMREELENLLLSSSPTPDSFQEPIGAVGSEDKPLIEFEIAEMEGLEKGKKDDNEIHSEANLKRNLGDTNNSDKLEPSNVNSEASGIKKWNNDGANTYAEEIDNEKQEKASEGSECQFDGGKGEVESFPVEAGDDSHEGGKDPDNNESSMYTTTSVVKVQKETTV